MVTLGTYKHFDGEYIVVCLAQHAVTGERLIVYTKGDGNYWILSETLFEEQIPWPDDVLRPRFERVPD